MKIVKNNYKKEPVNKKAEYLVCCEECGSELSITKEDVTYGHFGCPKVTCPCCGKETYVDADGLELTLTVDNVRYPEHYYHFGTHDSYKINNDEINQWVRELVKMLEEDKDSDWATRASGDTHVSVYKFDGDKEYNVVVSKGYYETCIPYRKTKEYMLEF